MGLGWLFVFYFNPPKKFSTLIIECYIFNYTSGNYNSTFAAKNSKRPNFPSSMFTLLLIIIKHLLIVIVQNI